MNTSKHTIWKIFYAITVLFGVPFIYDVPCVGEKDADLKPLQHNGFDRFWT